MGKLQNSEMDGGRQARAWWRTAACAAAVAALAAGLYASSLSSGFVYDDKVQVLENRWIEDPSFLPEIFSSGVWGFRHMATNYYRPLMHVTYMLGYLLFGPSAFGFHLISVLMNAGACVLVFFLTRALIASLLPGSARRAELPALAAAALFAAHPVHSEAVAWVAGVPDLGLAFFCLLSFYLYVRSVSGGGRVSPLVLAGSVACYLTAALFKEPALGLPLLFIAYDAARPGNRGAFGARIKRYAPFAAAAVVYLVARVAALGGFAPNPAHQGMGAYGLALNAAALFGGYIVKLVFPAGLSAYHEFAPAGSVFDPAAFYYALAAAGFVAAAVFSFRRDRAVFLGLMMVLVPLLPTLYVPGVGKNAFAERYLYFPSSGAVFLAALLIARAGGGGVRRAAALVGALAVVLVVFSVSTVERNAVWKDDVSLWSDAVSKSPGSAEARDALGLALDEAGRGAQAEAQFRTAMAAGHAGAYVHMGDIQNRAGEPEKAAALYLEAVKLAPGNAPAHNNLGVAYAKTGRLKDAAAEFEKAVELDRYYLDAHKNLVRACLKLGRKDEAKARLDAALALFPEEREALLSSTRSP